MKNPNEQPWWIPAHERPPEIGRIEDALVEAGLCDWSARTKPHPQEYALVAWSVLARPAPPAPADVEPYSADIFIVENQWME